MTTLLDFRSICTFRESNDSCKGLLVFFKKSKDSFEILHNFDDEVQKKLLTFLQNTNTSDKAGETRLYMDEVLPGYKYIALSCVSNPKKQESTIDTSRKASSAGVKLLKSYTSNIFLSVNFMPQEVSFAAVLSLYDYCVLKKTKAKKIKISGFSESEEFNKGIILGEYSNYARFLSDTPANLMTPSLFVEYAKEIVNESTCNSKSKDKLVKSQGSDSVNLSVFEKSYMEEKNMNIFLSVSEGSEQPMKFLVVQYFGNKNKKSVDLSLVGKGITFDSGGISLKGSKSMGDMKADMMGAAAVLCTFCLAIKLDKKVNLTVSIPLCENMPSGKATKPGDVKIGMKGISVEIDNTDAEGRLILADALSHAQTENPTYILDVATLTGAMCVALGNVYTGVFCNDDAFADLILNAGKNAGDLAWRMPLHFRYKEQMDSYVADLINTGGPSAGSCTAAAFLEEFINPNQKWAHFDVAGVMKSCDNEIYGKGMSGKPVKLLFKFIEELEKESK